MKLRAAGKIRLAGFGICKSGIICFAAPVFDLEGRVAGTIGVSTSTVYCSKEELMVNQGRKVIDAARKLSEKLGAEL